MHIEYDESVDGAFIWLVDDVERYRIDIVTEVWPHQLDDAIGLLLTHDGRLIG